MRIEAKGLIAGLVAATVALGAVFGLSAILTRGTTTQGQPSQIMSDKMTAMSAKMPALTATQIVHGKQFFVQYCASCHGAGAQGAFGPDIRGIDQADAAAMNTIKNGSKGKMPAFAGKLSDPNLQALVAYLHSLKK